MSLLVIGAAFRELTHREIQKSGCVIKSSQNYSISICSEFTSCKYRWSRCWAFCSWLSSSVGSLGNSLPSSTKQLRWSRTSVPMWVVIRIYFFFFFDTLYWLIAFSMSKSSAPLCSTLSFTSSLRAACSTQSVSHSFSYRQDLLICCFFAVYGFNNVTMRRAFRLTFPFLFKGKVNTVMYS